MAVAGTAETIEVVDRRSVEIADRTIAGSKQPYHEAERMSLDDAAKYVERCEKAAEGLARETLGEILDRLAKAGPRPRACALLLASGRPLPDLRAILASHALIHTADGEHFREALARACGILRIPVLRIREKEVLDRASAALGVPAGRLQKSIDALGRPLGPPWTQDQKLAAMAAWLALASSTFAVA